jgi:hypothetical protein
MIGTFAANMAIGVGLSFPGDRHTAASCEYAAVKAAYDAASPGDTVAIPAGIATWNSTLTITKSIQLLGAGINATTIKLGAAIDTLITIAPRSDVPERVTGIYFALSHPTGLSTAVYVNGPKDGSYSLTQFRFDHNKINLGKTQLWIGGSVYGCIDHNQSINGDRGILLVGDSSHAWSRPIEAGTANAMFIEDNTFTNDNNAPCDLNQAIYHQDGARSVTRHNTFDGTAYTNGYTCFYDSHGNWGPNINDYRGQPICEAYNNTFKCYQAYNLVTLRGGSNIWHDNTFTVLHGSRPAVITLTEEEDWQTQLFNPLKTTWNADDQIMNSFFWNNTYNGGALALDTLTHPQDAAFIQENRDYWMHAPQATGGRCVYTGRIGGPESFISTGPNAYHLYTPYIYPHPRTVVPEPTGFALCLPVYAVILAWLVRRRRRHTARLVPAKAMPHPNLRNSHS